MCVQLKKNIYTYKNQGYCIFLPENHLEEKSQRRDGGMDDLAGAEGGTEGGAGVLEVVGFIDQEMLGSDWGGGDEYLELSKLK